MRRIIYGYGKRNRVHSDSGLASVTAGALLVMAHTT